MSAKVVRITLEIDDRGNAKLIAGAKKVASAVESANKRAAASYRKFSRQVGSTLDNMFKKIVRWGVLIGGALVVGGLIKMIKIGAQFEQAMQDMKAVLAPTSKAFVDLSDKARELGRTTVFSAKEAAIGMRNLALAGFSATEILETIGPALSLAAAGGLDMAESARITANVIRGMGLAVEDFTTASNALVFAATNSNQTISDMGHAFKFIGPVANAIKADITELSAALGVLANVGLRGEMAGTGLRRSMTVFLTEMANGDEVVGKMNLQLERNEKGFFSLADAIGKMTEMGITAAEVMKAFGQRAGPAMLALMQIGEKGIKRFQREIVELGIQSRNLAEEIANIKLDTVAGDLRILGSEASEVAIAFFEKLAPSIRAAVNEMGTVLVGHDGKGGLAAWIKAADIVGIAKDAFKALKTILISLIALRIVLFANSLAISFAAAGGAAAIAAGGVGAFAAAANLIPFVAIITALGFIAVKLLKIKENAEAAEGSLAWMSDGRLDEMQDSLFAGSKALKVFREEFEDFTDSNIDAIAGFKDFGGLEEKLVNIQKEIISTKERMKSIPKGSAVFKGLAKELEVLIGKEKSFNEALTLGVQRLEIYSRSFELLGKEMLQGKDLLKKYGDEFAEFGKKTNDPTKELERWLEFQKLIGERALEDTANLTKLRKEQEKMASTLKKNLISSGIGHALAAVEVSNYVKELVEVSKVKDLGVSRTQIIQANADAFVAALTAAQAFRVELDKQELEILRIAIDFVVKKDDKIDEDIFKDFQAEILLEPGVSSANALAEALKRTKEFMKELEIGAGLVVDETKRLKEVALEVNKAFTNLIDVDQFESAADIISKNFTQKMIDNMDPETYAAVFSQAVQEVFDAQPVGLITPDMYAPQLAKLEEDFAVAMENNTISSEEFAVAFADDIQFIVGMMSAAGVEIEEKWLALFELLKENRLRLYNEDQRDADILNMEEFTEMWKEKWAQLVQTQLTSLAVISAQALLTGKDFATSFKRFTQQVVGSLIRMLITWAIQRFIIGKAIQKQQASEATQALSSGVALTGVNTMASMSLAPYPVNLTAPLQALIHMAIAAGIAGLAAVGTVAGSAHGGLITGPGGPTDDLIPRFLSNREFVLQASVVDKLGVGFLNALNTDPQAALAGAAGGTGAALAVPAPSGGGSMTKVLQVVIQQTFTGDNWSENGISDDLRTAVVEGAREAIEEGTELEFPTEVQ